MMSRTRCTTRCGVGRCGRARAIAGMTMIELVLAMAGTAIVGAAVASMLIATSYGTSSRTNMRGLVVKQKTVTARLGAATRSSRLVVAQGSDYVVLWMKDGDNDGQPKLSELRRIERDSGLSELRSYKAPSTIDPADDTLFDLASTDFDAVTNAVKGTATFPGETWATGVSALTITLDNAAVQSARLLSYQLTFAAGDLSDTLIGAVCLRNDLAGGS